MLITFYDNLKLNVLSQQYTSHNLPLKFFYYFYMSPATHIENSTYVLLAEN